MRNSHHCLCSPNCALRLPAKQGLSAAHLLPAGRCIASPAFLPALLPSLPITNLGAWNALKRGWPLQGLRGV